MVAETLELLGAAIKPGVRTGELDRAAKQLRAWQDEFPAEKIDGYLTLVLARYWAARGEYAPAVALADVQLAVNPNSPHIDQLLVLVADCEVKRGQVDRALAFLNQLLKDYPGSPLVPVVRENIAKLDQQCDLDKRHDNEKYKQDEPHECPFTRRLVGRCARLEVGFRAKSTTPAM